MSHQSPGTLIRKAREQCEFSQRALAEKVGVSHVFIGALERGSKQVPERLVGLLCDHLWPLNVGEMEDAMKRRPIMREPWKDERALVDAAGPRRKVNPRAYWVMRFLARGWLIERARRHRLERDNEALRWLLGQVCAEDEMEDGAPRAGRP